MKKILTYYLAFLLPAALSAQDISIKAEYPSVVNAGEQFAVQWTVNTGGGEFSVPPFTGFAKLMGPQTSYSSSTQVINGKITQQTSYSYVYYLQAIKAGNYSIAPAQFTYKGKTYVSDSMLIEVIGNSTGQPAGQQGATAAGSGDETAYAGNDIFVSLNPSRKEVWVGEPIALSIKLYTRVNLSGINEIRFPPFNGFLRADITTPPLTSLRQENVRGTIYGTGVVQQLLLYPQMTGEMNIDPVQISVLVQQKTSSSDPFFGDFFNTVQTIPRVVASQPLRVKVKPLPGTKPADYSGVVGQVNMTATLDKDTVAVNDPVTFRIVLSGTGNLRVAGTPQLKLSPDIETFDPKITDDIKNSMSGSTGQKTFEFLLIPRHNGDFIIPPLTYSIFNPSLGRYEKLSTREFRFHAKKGTGQNNAGITVYGGVSKEDVKYLGKDIRFIKSEPGRLRKVSAVVLARRSFITGYIITLLLFFVVLFARREHIRRNADLSRVKNRKAGKVAAKRLHNASLCLKDGDMDRFYDEILRAVWGYLSDKLSIPVSELTRANTLTALAERGTSQELLDSLTKILDTCEFARYAPSTGATGAAETFESASQFIKSVENSII